MIDATSSSPENQAMSVPVPTTFAENVSTHALQENVTAMQVAAVIAQERMRSGRRIVNRPYRKLIEVTSFRGAEELPRSPHSQHAGF